MKQNAVIWNFEELENLKSEVFETKINQKKFKLRWSIDRITVVGNIPYDFGELADYLIKNGFAVDEYGSSFSLVDKFKENYAYVEFIKFQKETENKVRLDFNPNKLFAGNSERLKCFFDFLFYDAHFSRLDVAVDLFNLNDSFFENTTSVDVINKAFFYGRINQLETIYFGSRGSRRQIRLYNKQIEQEQKKEFIPKEIKSWWRLEFQLRGEKTEDWINSIKESLDKLIFSWKVSDELSLNDQMKLEALKTKPSFLSKMDTKTRSKYRKLLMESKDDEDMNLKEILFRTFEESMPSIEKELKDWKKIFEAKYAE